MLIGESLLTRFAFISGARLSVFAFPAACTCQQTSKERKTAGKSLASTLTVLILLIMILDACGMGR
jgi:hypothetical protein